jgi:ribonuclease R
MAIEKDTKKIKDILSRIIEQDDRPMPHSVLFGKMVKQHKKELGFVAPELFDQALDEMIEKGDVKYNPESKKYLSTKKKYDTGPKRFDDRRPRDMDRRSYNDNVTIKTDEVLSGTLSLNQAGNGFITLPGELKSKYYVNKINLHDAQNGDTVEFNPTTKETKGELIDAVVSKILQHGKDFYVGTYHDNKDGTYKIQLDDAKVTLDVELDGNDGLVEGSKILIKIGRYDGTKAYGTVSRIIGHKSDVGVDILSIVLDNGVEPDFGDEVLNYAKSLKLDVNEEQLKLRTDLRNKPICTIDPATSKDFDDAFYCEKLDDGRIMLSVSIADVSHYVKMDSILDREALKRGCSIYLVDRVIPMLPHNLSDDLCSINPNADRMAITCEMIINKAGTFDDIKVFPSVINSHRRYSYDEVNE